MTLGSLPINWGRPLGRRASSKRSTVNPRTRGVEDPPGYAHPRWAYLVDDGRPKGKAMLQADSRVMARAPCTRSAGHQQYRLQPVRVDSVRRCPARRSGGPGAACRPGPAHPREPLHPLAVDHRALPLEVPHHAPTAIGQRSAGVVVFDQTLDHQVLIQPMPQPASPPQRPRNAPRPPSDIAAASASARHARATRAGCSPARALTFFNQSYLHLQSPDLACETLWARLVVHFLASTLGFKQRPGRLQIAFFHCLSHLRRMDPMSCPISFAALSSHGSLPDRLWP